MCGLVGVAGDLTARDKDIFRDLLYVGALRGFHSTGAAFVDGRRKQFTLVRKTGSPMQVIPTKEFTDANRNWATSVCIGHNRFATIGAHTPENAHPFEFSNIVGAHNGTLEPRARKILVDNEKFGTDSEALYHNLNEFETDEVMADMSGAWALTWYDRRDNTINFLRNKERPLHYCFNKLGDVIYWASESMMLRWILTRHGMDHGPIYELNPDLLASFTVPDSKTRFGEPTLQEVKGWKPAPFAQATTTRVEELPWSDGQSQEDAFLGWYPQGAPKFLLTGPETIGPGSRAQDRGSPVMEGESSPVTPEPKQQGLKNNGRSQRKTDVLPGLPSNNKESPLTKDEQRLLDLSLQKAWGDGFVAGDRGLSKTQCPFPAGSKHSDQWLQGRLSGLECYRKDSRAAIPTRTTGNFREDAEEHGRTIKGYNAEILTEAEFNARTGGECRWGGCSVEFDDRLHWLGRNDCVCNSCVTGNKLVRELLGKSA
jgi:predicted glutamine amidotransferase/ribosome modulation factor